MKIQISRREFFILSATGLLAAQSSIGRNPNFEARKNMLVYIGTYTTNTKSEGIYIYKLNLSSGELSHKIVAGATDPSYLAIDETENYLYAVNETEEYEGKKSGAVSAYQIDKNTGDLSLLNKQASLGGAPCYVSVSRDRKFVLVANYVGGNAASFPVLADGKLGAAVDFKQHSGSGVNKKRQEAAHAHSITLDRQNNYAVVCDLGIDKTMIYQFDKDSGKLLENAEQPFFQHRNGAGPRHFVFHPNGKQAFVINELDSTITALAYNNEKGLLAEIQTIGTLPEGYKATARNTCADLHISPDGKFIYGSNRGHNSIVSYQIDKRDGTLKYIEHVSTGGNTPRNFAIDPSGKFLLAANQNSNNIVVFKIDENSGKLQNVGSPIVVPSPVCVKLIPDKK